MGIPAGQGFFLPGEVTEAHGRISLDHADKIRGMEFLIPGDGLQGQESEVDRGATLARHWAKKLCNGLAQILKAEWLVENGIHGPSNATKLLGGASNH